MKHFQMIYDKLLEIKEIGEIFPEYYIPSLWLNNTKPGQIISVEPIQFFINAFDNISSKPKVEFEEQLEKSTIYNMMVRLTTSFDHKQSGTIDLDNTLLLRDTGTFLKSIAILPYIKSFGVNIIYLLPITSIGTLEKKGNLGSIYAVKNPYKIDENLSELILEMPVEVQFSAFVEAAHHLGIKVISEFIFRTASMDCEFALEHPEWFYWLKDEIKDKANSDDEISYSPPKFSDEDLSKIKQDVENHIFTELISPDKSYTDMFTEVPREVFQENSSIKGKLKDGTIVRIPGAFADWPPDDNQPLWSDVTYLKLYTHPDYNYIAYNTVRMYDDIISDTKYINQELWDKLSSIIPYYIEKFDIDGIMLDMGHALPIKLRKQILDNATNCKRGFLLFEENFILSQESKKEGYSAVLGYLPFDFNNCEKMRGFLYRVINDDIPILSFATAENHNTKRTYKYFENIDYSKLIWSISKFLPKTISFIHSGFELLESQPLNTGLGFTDDEISSYNANELALFSFGSFNWTNSNIIEYIKKINFIKQYFFSKENICELMIVKDCKIDILAYILITESYKHIFCLANYSGESNNVEIKFNNIESGKIITAFIENNEIEYDKKYSKYQYYSFYNSITNVNFEVRNNSLAIELTPYEFMVGQIK
jgi:starch synthase (maltosyl-transferring)